MLELVKKRRSIRQFTPEAVSQEDIQTLLSTALLGPTSMGKRPVEIIVVQNKETIAALKLCKAHGTTPLGTAPLVMAVVADSTLTDVWVEDASIAAILLQLQAESMGLGSTWIQMRLRQSTEGVDSEAGIRKILGIPDHFGVLCLVAIGHKAEYKKAYTNEDVPMRKVHTEKW